MIRRGRRSGFTLIEILVVVVIIGLLAGMSASNFRTAQDKARCATLFGNLKTIGLALEQYSADNQGHYPDSAAGMEMSNADGGLLRGGYLNSANKWPRNPWGGLVQINHLPPAAPMETAAALGAGTATLPSAIHNPPYFTGTSGQVPATTTFGITDYGAISYDFDQPTSTWVLYSVGKSRGKPYICGSQTNGGGT